MVDESRFQMVQFSVHSNSRIKMDILQSKTSGFWHCPPSNMTNHLNTNTNIAWYSDGFGFQLQVVTVKGKMFNVCIIGLNMWSDYFKTGGYMLEFEHRILATTTQRTNFSNIKQAAKSMEHEFENWAAIIEFWKLRDQNLLWSFGTWGLNSHSASGGSCSAACYKKLPNFLKVQTPWQDLRHIFLAQAWAVCVQRPCCQPCPFCRTCARSPRSDSGNRNWRRVRALWRRDLEHRRTLPRELWVFRFWNRWWWNRDRTKEKMKKFRFWFLVKKVLMH